MLSQYIRQAAARFTPQATNRLENTMQRNYTAEAKPKENEETTTEAEQALKNARPYSEVPGMTKFELVRAFLPGGACYKGTIDDLTKYMLERSGNIFRMPGVFGNPETLFCCNPDDFPTIIHNEGKWPHRRAFDTVVYYREVYRRDLFQGVEGIISTNGEKWSNSRTAVNPILMRPKNSILYLDSMLDVSDEFLSRIRDIRDPTTNEMPADFEEDINCLALESVAVVALNKQLGFVRKNRDSEEARTLFRCLKRVFELAFQLDIMPSMWRYISTPKFKEQMHTLDTMTNICLKYVNEAMEQIEHDADGKLTTQVGKEKSVLEKLLRVDKRLAVAMALDMLFAGVDTTSSTLVGILLCIAKNPDKQQKLFDEIKQILPEKDSRLTMENMKNLPYLRACIKEGMRLYPILPGTMRRMPVDVVLSGYRIPEGTQVAVGANLQLRNEKYVPRAKEFLPERWLRSEEGGDNALIGQIHSPFMFIPFGFGRRSCAGKRIVNMELEITLSRLVRNFNIEFNYPIENAFTTKFIAVPNIPLKFKFQEREQ